MRVVKLVLLVVMSVFYVFAGVMHFVNPDFYLEIMPPHLPWHAALVFLSGVAEVVLGIAVLVPRTRRLAAWGIIALLIAVFPANLHMAVSQIRPEHAPEFMKQSMNDPLMVWWRLPMQGVLALWAWWYTRD
jgi:uncharacterized membrane protein